MFSSQDGHQDISDQKMIFVQTDQSSTTRRSWPDLFAFSASGQPGMVFAKVKQLHLVYKHVSPSKNKLT